LLDLNAIRPSMPVATGPSGLLLVILALADDVGDVIVRLFRLLDEGGIVDRLVVDFDIVVAGDRVVARNLLPLRLGVGILE